MIVHTYKLTACPTSIRKCNILLIIGPLHRTIYQEVCTHKQYKMIKLYIGPPVILVIIQRPSPLPVQWIIMFMSLVRHLPNLSLVQSWESKGAQKAPKLDSQNIKTRNIGPGNAPKAFYCHRIEN